MWWGALVALGIALVPWLVVRMGEWYRGVQEAIIFGRPMNGTLRHVTYRSRLLGRPQRFIVYLPPGYGKPADRGRRYPVVYFLHGCPGQPRDWLVKGDLHDTIEVLLAAHRVPAMILVMPDGSGPGGRFDCTLYMNRSDGTYPAETAFVDELVPLIDRRYRTIPRRERRALLGVSSGGFAALNLGVRHPELFGVLASFSGYFRAREDPRAIRSILDGDARAWKANSPADRLASLPPGLRPHVYLGDGVSDPMLASNEAFARQLEQLGIDHQMRVTPGRHSWSYWRRHLSAALTWVGAHLNEGVQAFRRSGVPTPTPTLTLTRESME